MSDPKFKIGDTVWMAEGIHAEGWIKCPDCMGTCALTIVLGDGSKVSIDCECCRFIENRNPGYIHEYGCYQYKSVERRVTGIENKSGRWTYHLDERYSDVEENDLCANKEEVAEIVRRLDLKNEDESYHQFYWRKENVKQTWRWNVRYHQRCVKDAERNLAYHTAKLSVAKKSAKELMEDKKPSKAYSETLNKK